MNLNFIQDNDQVHVETQNQIAYKQQIILKVKLLKQDFNDYSQINPALVQINNFSTQIVKDLYEHVTNMKQNDIEASERQINSASLKDTHQLVTKKKKKISIPYGTIKKLQNLKQKIIICRKIIDNQNNIYRNFNRNCLNQKSSDVKFYKQTLTSYQNQRQYFKKQTLQLEDRVQQVESQVKKLSYNENHPFTDFNSKVISIESIFQYEKKIVAFQKVKNQINSFRKIQQKIVNKLQNEQKDDRQIKIKSENIVYAKNFLKSITSVEKKIKSVQRSKVQLLQSKLFRQLNELNKIKVVNQRLKKGILQSEGVKYFLELEGKIFDLKGKQQIHNKAANITKTDYMIYLKDLNSQVKQYFKSKQIVYRCKMSSQNKNLEQKSKSVNSLNF